MKKLTLVFVLQLLFLIPAVDAQSPYYYKSTESLKSERESALKSGNKAKAGEIGKELENRNSGQKQVEALQADLKKKIASEDYEEAQALKDKIDALKAKQAKTEEIRKKLEASIASEEYENAEKFKNELLSVEPPVEPAKQGASQVSLKEEKPLDEEAIRKQNELKLKEENAKKEKELLAQKTETFNKLMAEAKSKQGLKEYESALELVNQALAIFPENQNAKKSQAELAKLILAGKEAKDKSDFNRYMAESKARQDAKEYSHSMEAVNKALAIYPGNEKALKAKAEIKSLWDADKLARKKRRFHKAADRSQVQIGTEGICPGNGIG